MDTNEIMLQEISRQLDRNRKEKEERRKIVNEFNLKRLQEMPKDDFEEKKKREALFNERKREYENYYYDDGERYTLCYTFEDQEKQRKKL